MAITPPVWVVNVGSATPDYNQGQPGGANETQQTVNGTLQDISYTVESITDQGFSKSATISYERSLQSEAVPIRRHALVEIRLNGDIVFAGVVDSQNSTHGRITLSCVSQIDLLNLAPTFGAVRDHSNGTLGRYFQTALSIFNEKGLQDNSKEDLTFATFGALESISPSDTKFRWFRKEVILYLLDTILGQNLDAIFLTHIDPTKIASSIQTELLLFLGKDAEIDLIIRGGIIDEVISLLEEFEKMADFNANLSFPSPPDYEIEVIDKFDPARKKTITYDDDAKSSDEPTIKGAPFQININHDFSSPTKIILSSGRKFISTILTIKPDTTKGYDSTQNLEDKTGEFVFIFEPTAQVAAGDFIFESNEILGSGVNSYTLIDLFQTGKVGTIVSVNPRFLEEPVIGEEIIFADPEIYVDFKANQVKEISPQREILLGGDAWTKARGGKGEEFLKLLESLNFEIAEDKLEVKISGLIQEGGSLNAVRNEIRNKVDFFHIPVTLEIENRVVVVTTLDDAPGNPTFSSTQMDDSEFLQCTDMILESPLWEIRDDLRPIELLFGFDSYNDTTGIVFKIEKASFETTLKDKLIENAEATLKEAIFNDGTNMTITIPIELIPLLDSTFPLNIGDWVDTIGGDTKNAGYGLNRQLIIKSVSYSNTSKTLNFS